MRSAYLSRDQERVIFFFFQNYGQMEIYLANCIINK